MTVSVSDEFAELLTDHAVSAEAVVQRSLAAHFYRLGEISVGRAAELSGMRRQDFEHWLHMKGIDMPWTEEDLRTELDWDARE